MRTESISQHADAEKATVAHNGEVKEEEHDLRKGFTYPGYKTKTIRLILFALLKLFLPFLDFVTDLNMLFQFGIPVIFGYQLCVEKSSGYSNAAFGSVPEWSVDGEVCGYVDNRYKPSTKEIRRRKLEEHSESKSLSPSKKEVTHVASADSVSVRGRRRRLADIDTAAQTNDCTGLTTADNCIAVDKCRWDMLPNDPVASCFDPVLQTFLGTSAVMEEDRFLELYCNQFQPMHRGENSTHFNETLNICLSWSLSSGTKACDWDPYHQFCAPATSYFWKETPDNCARLGGGDGSGAGTYNDNINSTCSQACNCIYVSIDGSANGYQCMDRMAYAYSVSPYSTIAQKWNTQLGYCEYMIGSCCSSYTYEGDGATPACCTPGVGDCSYNANQNTQCAPDDTLNDDQNYYQEHCLPEQGCLPAVLSGMYSEEALRGRYCDQCKRCSDELLINQAQQSHSGDDTYTTTAARTEAYINEWSGRFPCCSCDTIANGQTCSLPETMNYDSTAFDEYIDSCDHIGQITDPIWRGETSTYRFKAYNSASRDSFNCGTNSGTLVENSEICMGLLAIPDDSYAGTESYTHNGIECTRFYKLEKTYLQFDEPQTCKARYETKVDEYFVDNLNLYECYNSSDFSTFGCMDFSTMDSYYREKGANDWYANPSANTYIYNSCGDEDVFTNANTVYNTCCFTAISTTCSSYTYPNCPTGCASYQKESGSACYDPVQDIVNRGDRADSSWYCYWIEKEVDCESFQDPTSSASPAQTLCEYDDSRVGLNEQDVQNTAKCTPRADRTVEGTCLDTGSNCACVQDYQEYFQSPYSNDLKCPHKNFCYLPIKSECPEYNYGGYLSSWNSVETADKAWTSRWSYGSLSCSEEDSSGGYHISSVDTFNEGCGGFQASFGCYVDGAKDDSVTIGDVLISPLQLVMYCGGNKEDECRSCNALNMFTANPLSDGGEFNYGDTFSESDGGTGYVLVITTILLMLLLLLVLVKEIIGLYIVVNMSIHSHRTVGKWLNPDYDYITVGKDSIVGLLALLCLCVILYREQGWSGIGLYQVRYKLYEDGWTVEELEEKFEQEEAEYLQHHPSQKVVLEEAKRNKYNRLHPLEQEGEGERDSESVFTWTENPGADTEHTSRTSALVDQEIAGHDNRTAAVVEADGEGGEGEVELIALDDGGKKEYRVVHQSIAPDEESVESRPGSPPSTGKEGSKPVERQTPVGIEQWIEKLLGVVHHVDEKVIPPLLEPETRMFVLWNLLEFLEVFVGLVATLLLLITTGSLYFLKGEGSAPPEGEILATLFSFVTSLADLVFNILGGLCHFHSWLKWVKRGVLGGLFLGPIYFAAAIYDSIYNNPACV